MSFLQARYQDFVKEGGLNQRIFLPEKCLNIGHRDEQTGATHAYHSRGSEGDEFSKIVICLPFESNFVPLWSHIKELNC